MTNYNRFISALWPDFSTLSTVKRWKAAVKEKGALNVPPVEDLRNSSTGGVWILNAISAIYFFLV